MSELSIPFIASLISLFYVAYLVSYVLRRKSGSRKMEEISKSIQQGASAFLNREYRYVAIFVAAVAVLISLVPYVKPDIKLGWQTSIAFISGALASALAGFIGMSISTRANSRTAQAASDSGLKGALGVALSGGAVMGFSVVGLALLGVCLVYFFFRGEPGVVNGYAMGASFVALFARSGGGIFTKGADMAADLAGKVEAGIPEDDPRNPAVIADNVGDNVGDVAGLGADLLESYVESIIASIAIASGLGLSFPALELLPLNIASVGIIASIIGVTYAKLTAGRSAQRCLMGGTYIASLLTIIGAYFLVKNGAVSFGGYPVLGPFYATVCGVISGVIIGLTSEFFTSSSYLPVKRLAEKSQTGAAITVTEGIAIGMQSTAVPVIILAISVVLAYHFSGGYGVAMAALGMLATTGMVVAADSYGPIADNAGGIAEMSGLSAEVRKITDGLDSVGNTTAAVGKGFAIGSAAFAALGLLVAFMGAAGVEIADIKDPRVIAGLLLGGMFPFLFSSMLLRAVGNCAFRMIKEVRRQFKEIPGLIDGKGMPDSAKCVDISTRTAITGMMVPGVMCVAVPVVIGFTLGSCGLAGVLVGSLVSGLMLGVQNANTGGALDNAKKYIEEGNFGGKGTPAHAAAVIGDTVGDPLKDTVGPSINIFMKLMAVISLVLAPLFKV